MIRVGNGRLMRELGDGLGVLLVGAETSVSVCDPWILVIANGLLRLLLQLLRIGKSVRLLRGVLRRVWLVVFGRVDVRLWRLLVLRMHLDVGLRRRRLLELLGRGWVLTVGCGVVGGLLLLLLLLLLRLYVGSASDVTDGVVEGETRVLRRGVGVRFVCRIVFINVAETLARRGL